MKKENVAEKEPKETEAAAEEKAENVKEVSEGEKKDKKLKAENKKLKAENEENLKKIEKAESDLKEANDKYLRLCAEYDNFRRRSAKEKEDTYQAATADALEALLPILDNLMLASSYGSGEKVIEGIQMILKNVPDVLEKMKVTSFGVVGEPFDPNLHNAVMQVQDETKEDGTIAAVLQCGYKYGDKVIRHAMVSVVGNN